MKKKVLFIGTFPPPFDGQSVATATLTDSTIMKENFIIEKLDVSSRFDRLGKPGHFGLGRACEYLLFFARQLKLSFKSRPQIVYLTIAQSPMGSIRDIVFLCISFAFKTKTVAHLHGGNYHIFYNAQNFIYKYLIKIVFSKLDAVIVLGEIFFPCFEGIVSKEKIISIPNCVQSELLEFIVQNKRSKNIEDMRKYVVLYLSNLIITKGFFDLLMAADYLNSIGDDRFKFIFAGAFSNEITKNDFFNFVREHKLEHIVYFSGVVKGREKAELLLNADVFVLPTYYPLEGQPISVMEAMAAGLPVIVTPYRGIPEMVKDGEHGYYVEANSPASIAQKIVKIFSDPRHYEEMSNNNVRVVLEKYTEERYANDIKNLFMGVLGGQSPLN